jgi:hypothetical protein
VFSKEVLGIGRGFQQNNLGPISIEIRDFFLISHDCRCYAIGSLSEVPME